MIKNNIYKDADQTLSLGILAVPVLLTYGRVRFSCVKAHLPEHH